MPVESQNGPRMALPLAPRVAEHADAMQIAEAAVAIWQEIDDALTPILGRGGVAALYKRTLHLTSAIHPWFAISVAGSPTIALAALKAVIAQQDRAAAAEGGAALFQTFYELLSSLIGPSLTEQLLRSVWANTSSGSTGQDPSP